MLTELRSNLDILVIIIIALGAYHIYLKAKGNSKGIAK